MYNRETLVEALAEIKKVCEEFVNSNCEECPMYSDRYQECFLSQVGPDLWGLAINTKPWRAII